MLEKDAKFTHCPFLTMPDGKLRFCLVKMCMMWRATGEESGYCGLAGRSAVPGQEE